MWCKAHRAVVALSLAIVSLLACTSPGLQAGMVAQTTPGAPSTTPLPNGQAPNVPAIAARVRPAVVQISNLRDVSIGELNRPVPETAGIGSGVIYDARGLVLTNNHVIAGADQLVIGLPDGRRFQGRLVGADPQGDLAVLQIINGTGLPVAPLGSSASLAVGDPLVAIGNALGLPGGPTVTQGIVSALGRAIEVPASDEPDGSSGARGVFLYDLIQTDAPINPGNSGGPLVNAAGEVVGINTAVASTSGRGQAVEGIGFAIGIDTAKAVAAQLAAGGTVVRPYLGIEYVPLSPALAARLQSPVDQGAVVTAVRRGSPAASAGLREGDIIVSVNGQALQDESALGRSINNLRPGDTAQVVVVRDGRTQSLTVTLGQQR
ncbi:MAG: S1C family serine protease [Anaerolineae bacterium]